MNPSVVYLYSLDRLVSSCHTAPIYLPPVSEYPYLDLYRGARRCHMKTVDHRALTTDRVWSVSVIFLGIDVHQRSRGTVRFLKRHERRASDFDIFFPPSIQSSFEEHIVNIAFVKRWITHDSGGDRKIMKKKKHRINFPHGRELSLRSWAFRIFAVTFGIYSWYYFKTG